MTANALDQSLPAVIWLQVDTDASNDERDEPFTGYLSDLTWCAESIGGLEVQYVRADISASQSDELAQIRQALAGLAEMWRLNYDSGGTCVWQSCADALLAALAKEPTP